MFNSAFFRRPSNDQNPPVQENKIIFRQLEIKDIEPLIEAGFAHSKSRLKQSLPDRFFQRIRFKPFSTGLVAYHIQEKQAIGFLQLNRYSKWLYSLKFAFTNPSFRRKGVGSGLFNFAFSQVRNKGGRKIFLNVDPNLTSSIDLYGKLGFELISKSYEVWCHIEVSKFLRRHEKYLNPINLDSKKNKSDLFDICKHCMNSEWIDFFETKYDTLTNGFSGDFRRMYFKNAFVNNDKNSFALVFRRPFSHNPLVELFVSTDSEIPYMLNGLIRVFQDQKINGVSLKLFNIKTDSCVQKIKKTSFYVYHSLCMGKSL